jgi:hypothetical protein
MMPQLAASSRPAALFPGKCALPSPLFQGALYRTRNIRVQQGSTGINTSAHFRIADNPAETTKYWIDRVAARNRHYFILCFLREWAEWGRYRQVRQNSRQLA